jgi:RNase P/RNase MRP subunit p29
MTKTYLDVRDGKEQEVEGKRLLGRPRRRRKDNMKVGLSIMY